MAGDEMWLPVMGFPYYEISDHGRVRSLDRVAKSRWGTPKPVKGRILKQVWIGGNIRKRYRGVTLFQDGQAKQVAVHRVVLEHFVGPRPPGTYGCHRDDNTDHNYVDNLYWGTPHQNGRDAVANGCCAKTKITHCPHGHEYTEANTRVNPKTGWRSCRACSAAKKKGNANYTRTHCPKGHPYDEANTYRAPGAPNHRYCRACMRHNQRKNA